MVFAGLNSSPCRAGGSYVLSKTQHFASWVTVRTGTVTLQVEIVTRHPSYVKDEKVAQAVGVTVCYAQVTVTVSDTVS